MNYNYITIMLLILNIVFVLIIVLLLKTKVKKPKNKVKKHYDKPSLTIQELSEALMISNESLRKANEKLVEAEQIRSEVFANISHDLRAPITAIKSSVEYLESLKKIDKSEVEAALKLISKRVMALENLINDLFLLTSLNNKAAELDFEKIDIGIFLEEYFYLCDVNNKYSKCSLNLKVPENMRAYVSIDVKKIIRVLDNLFSNALKYSREPVVIILESYIENNNVIICVRDEGIGIPKDKLHKIFERSYMISDSRTPTAYGSCGLGLSIAETIISRHNGNIWCESILGKGSSFFFSLPVIKDI